MFRRCFSLVPVIFVRHVSRAGAACTELAGEEWGVTSLYLSSVPPRHQTRPGCPLWPSCNRQEFVTREERDRPPLWVIYCDPGLVMQWPGPGLAHTSDEDTPGHPLRGQQHPVSPLVRHGRLLLLRHRPRQWPQPLRVQPPRCGRWPRGHTQPGPWPQPRPLQVSVVLCPLTSAQDKNQKSALVFSFSSMFIQIPCQCQQQVVRQL